MTDLALSKRTKSSFSFMLLLSLFLFHADGRAQNQPLVFTGYMEDDNLPVEGPKEITLTLYNHRTASEPENILWGKSDTVLFTAGEFTVVLGNNETNPLPLTLHLAAELYLGVQIAGDPEMTPRLQLRAVPFSKHAEFATRVGDYDAVALDDLSAQLESAQEGLASLTEAMEGHDLDGIAEEIETQATNLTTLSEAIDAVELAAQARVSGNCAEGQSIRSIHADGSVTCETDNDTQLTAAFNGGLMIDGTQAIGLMNICTDNQILKFDGVAWSCAEDNNNTYSGSDFVPSNQTCDDGWVLQGINETGATICVPDADSPPLTQTEVGNYAANEGFVKAGEDTSTLCDMTDDNAIMTVGCFKCSLAGGTYVDGSCVCPDTGAYVDGSCVCPDGGSYVDGICVCPDGGSYVDGICVCPDTGTYVDGNCVCPDGGTYQNGVCTCPNGGTYDGNLCTYRVCNSRSSCQNAGNAGREIEGTENNAEGLCNFLGYDHLVSYETSTYSPSCGCCFGKANWNGSSFPWNDYCCQCGQPNTLLSRVVCR